MVYVRPIIVDDVTEADADFFNNILDGVDEKLDKAEAAQSYAPVSPVGYQRRVVSPLRAALDSVAGSVALQILGDSTGNEDASTAPEWVYLVAQKLAAKYTGFEVRYIGWDETTQQMKATEQLRAPATLRHVDFPSGVAQRASWTGAPVTGDLDVQARITPNSWATGAEQVIVAQHSSSTDRGWYLSLTGDGQLSFTWSSDGTSLKSPALSGAWTPGAGPVWVRGRLDVDNGTGKTEARVYRSTDGVNWTQMGSSLVRGAVEPPFASVGGYQLGERGPTTSYFLGKIHDVKIRAGIDGEGPLVAPVLPEHWTPQQYCTGGQGTPVLTIVNGSHPGADLAFLTDTTRIAKMTPNYGQLLTIISASHNEAFYHGVAVTAKLKSLVAAARVRIPDSPIAVVGQNPRVAPAPYITPHAQRRHEWMALAAALGWTHIDAYRAITDAAAAAGTTVAAWTKADGVHPQPLASEAWSVEAMAALGV